MNAEEIKVAREICEAATVGPWHFDRNNKKNKLAVFVELPFPGNPIETICEGPKFRQYTQDLEFIAFARATLPAALDEIERLQTENAKLKKALAECAGY